MAVQIQVSAQPFKLTSPHSEAVIFTGDTITVTVESQAIVGHIIRPITDLANALGCHAEVVVRKAVAPREFVNPLAEQSKAPDAAEAKPASSAFLDAHDDGKYY